MGLCLKLWFSFFFFFPPPQKFLSLFSSPPRIPPRPVPGLFKVTEMTAAPQCASRGELTSSPSVATGACWLLQGAQELLMQPAAGICRVWPRCSLFPAACPVCPMPLRGTPERNSSSTASHGVGLLKARINVLHSWEQISPNPHPSMTVLPCGGCGQGR